MGRFFLAITIAVVAQGQWALQESYTLANLRSIHSLGQGVAWASGERGVILRTTNDGQTWLRCAIPPASSNLDFRGIQAFGQNTAVVMSSGKGALSRLYKTTDGCLSWRLVFTNPDTEGSFVALQFSKPSFGTLIGNQSRGHFPVYFTNDGAERWQALNPKGVAAVQKRQSIFSASNSALLVDTKGSTFYLLSGGGTTTFISVNLNFSAPLVCANCLGVSYTHPPLAIGTAAGGFSLASRADGPNVVIVAVGGDADEPNQQIGTAASWIDDHRGNYLWRTAEVAPGGFRTSVAYDLLSGKWITVGPNGTDVSDDDGLTWRPLRPSPGDSKDADRGWNAISLPLVVGQAGRIGKLRENALKP